ncbi:MAG: hypothetical protein WA459_24545 [Stellaceae bacterium]
MNLHRPLQPRATAGKPVRDGLIGAGDFGSMFLNQAPTVARPLPAVEVRRDIERRFAERPSSIAAQ